MGTSGFVVVVMACVQRRELLIGFLITARFCVHREAGFMQDSWFHCFSLLPTKATWRWSRNWKYAWLWGLRIEFSVWIHRVLRLMHWFGPRINCVIHAIVILESSLSKARFMIAAGPMNAEKLGALARHVTSRLKVLESCAREKHICSIPIPICQLRPRDPYRDHSFRTTFFDPDVIYRCWHFYSDPKKLKPPSPAFYCPALSSLSSGTLACFPSLVSFL